MRPSWRSYAWQWRRWRRRPPSERGALAGYILLLAALAGAIISLDARLRYAWVFLVVPILICAVVYRPRVARLQLLTFAAASIGLLAWRHGDRGELLGALRAWAMDLGALGLATEMVVRVSAARRRIEQALRKSERRYRLLFERNLAGVFRATADGRFLDCNHSFAQMLRLPGPAQVLTRCVQDFTADPRAWEKVVEQLREKRSFTNREFAFLRADGTRGWALQNISILEDAAAEACVESTVVDITDRKKAEDALREAAVRDGLTGLANRRELDRMLGEELERANRYGRPLSLILLDIDHFKHINDVYGHLVGDQVLRQLADHLRSHLRCSDHAARYGGEEFVILLPETDAEAGLAAAERLRLAICAKPFIVRREQDPPLSLPVTVSLGVAGAAGLVDAGRTEILDRADRALYDAKWGGRNRSELSRTGPAAAAGQRTG